MTAPILSAGTHVLVCDGRKALILFNEGTSEQPSLTIEVSMTRADEPTRALGTAKPGRVFASVGPRSASTEEADWHQRAEDEFIQNVIARLIDVSNREKIKRLVLVAPPRAMATLRKNLPSSIVPIVVVEITKDLTNHSIPALTALLQAEPLEA